MKLSKAILKGCKGTKKCVGEYAMGETRFCALGAAMHGLNIDPSTYGSMDALAKKYPFLKRSDIPVPVANVGGMGSNLCRVITILNDKAGWSRKKIALWLRDLGF